MTVILDKLIIGILCTVITILILTYKRQLIKWFALQNPNFVLLSAWILLRLCPYIIVFFIFQVEPTSDITGYLMRWGTSAKNGLLIYRDFVCTYSPFYPYIIALSLNGWDNPKAIVLLMVIFEGIALYLTYYFGGTVTITKAELLYKLLVYLSLPASLILCVVGGQEDIWMWLLVVLAYLAWQHSQKTEVLFLFLLLGLLCTKIIFVLFLLPMLILIRAKVPILAFGVVIGTSVVALLYYLVGFEFLQPMQEASILRSPNLPSIINPITFNLLGFGSKIWNWLGLLVTVGVGTWFANKVKTLDYRQSFSAVWIVIYATMMTVQQSAYTNYVFIFLLPLVLFWIDFNNKREVVLLLAYNLICTIQPSIWWRFGQIRYNNTTDIFIDSLHILDFTMQILVVCFTIYFIFLVYKKAVGLVKTP